MRPVGRAAAAFALAAALLASGWPTVQRTSAASIYNDTNPFSTVCSDHAETFRSYYFRTSSTPKLIVGRLDIRYSEFCHTVWAKTVNLTGKGAGFATERRLTAETYISTYTCPRAACFVASQRETGDVLPGLDDYAFSHQLDVPTGSLYNGSRQPPTFRAVGYLRTDAGTEWRLDMEYEPMFTQLYAEFDSLPGSDHDDDQDRITCDNENGDFCRSWGETNGGSRVIDIYLDPNLNSAPGTADLGTDMAQSILPAWNAVPGDSPLVEVCPNISCIEEIYMYRTTPLDPDLDGAYAVTVGTLVDNSTYARRVIKVDETISFEHDCASDADCKGEHDDDRPLISHEFGHALGIGHCDRLSAVMCHLAPTVAGDYGTGYLHWIPTDSEIDALKTIYP